MTPRRHSTAPLGARPHRRGVRTRLARGVVVVALLTTTGTAAAAQDPSGPPPDPSAIPSPLPSGVPTGSEAPTPAPTPVPSDPSQGASSDPGEGASDDGSGDALDATISEGFTLAPQPPAGWPQVPFATARSVVAMDATTGQVLGLHDPDERVQVASTIKLLTTLTALDVLDPTDEVTVGPEVEIDGSTAALEPGDTWTVRDLVAGAIVRSGNDAAEALAVAAGGGDRDAFLAMMNDKAESLGIVGASIADPSGLEDVNLLSARDLALIGAAALRQPLIAEVAAARDWDLPSTGPVPARNLLLQQREDATGLKTGTTDLAGASLVGSIRTGSAPGAAADDGEATATAPGDGPHDLVAVVLGTRNDDQRYIETNTVLDWMQSAFQRQPVSVGARVRLPGEWVGEVVEVDLWAPEEPTVDTSLAVDGSSVVSEVSVGVGGRLGEYVATADVSRPDRAGESLAAALYDGMRQAHELGAWDDVGGGSGDGTNAGGGDDGN